MEDGTRLEEFGVVQSRRLVQKDSTCFAVRLHHKVLGVIEGFNGVVSVQMVFESDQGLVENAVLRNPIEESTIVGFCRVLDLDDWIDMLMDVWSLTRDPTTRNPTT